MLPGISNLRTSADPLRHELPDSQNGLCSSIVLNIKTCTYLLLCFNLGIAQSLGRGWLHSPSGAPVTGAQGLATSEQEGRLGGLVNNLRSSRIALKQISGPPRSSSDQVNWNLGLLSGP